MDLTDGPLTGVRVLELGSMIAGPFGGTLLGDFGADVVKLEPTQGDPMRTVLPAVDEVSLYWVVDARNKRSITFDVRDAERREEFLRLVEAADVLVENFRGGTLESWGLGPQVLHERNPDLVVVQVSGFGQTGARANQGSYDRVVQAMAGLAHVTGFPDGPPTVAGFAVSDYSTGLWTAFGALLGLLARERGAGGQVVDVAAFECLVRLTECSITEYDRLGTVWSRQGNIHPSAAPINTYPTANGEWVLMQAPVDRLFRTLCESIGRPDLVEDERFATMGGRVEHREELDAAIAAWTSERDDVEVVETWLALGIPAGKVANAADVADDPLLAERETVVEVDTPIGKARMQGVIPKLSKTPGGIRRGAPALGSTTVEEILRAWASRPAHILTNEERQRR